MRLICTTNKAYSPDLHVFELQCNWVVRSARRCPLSLPLSIFLSVPFSLPRTPFGSSSRSRTASPSPSPSLVISLPRVTLLAPCTTSDAIDGFRNIGTQLALSRYSCRCGKSNIRWSPRDRILARLQDSPLSLAPRRNQPLPRTGPRLLREHV